MQEGLNSSNSPATAVDSLTNITTNTDRHLVSPSAQNQKIHQSEPQMFLTNTNSALKTANSSVQSIAKQQVNTQTEQECHGANPVVICSSDVLEQARAAIAAAERASAAARAAAELVNFKRVAQVSSDKHSK